MAKTKYIVVRGIEHDKLGERYEPGEVVTLGKEWGVKNLLEKGAIKLEGQEKKKPKARAVKKVVKENGNGQHKQPVRKAAGG